jgi:hypothetical protein
VKAGIWHNILTVLIKALFSLAQLMALALEKMLLRVTKGVCVLVPWAL